MRIVYWGTYDKGKPRNRIMIEGLRQGGVEVVECHRSIWGGVEDKSQISGVFSKLKFLFCWLFSYPDLIRQYLKLPRHEFVLVGYMGHLDVIILWPFAKVRGIPIVWDAFLSLYNTVVEDRVIVGRFHPLAIMLFCWEWLACRCADLIVLDTKAHAQYFISTFGLNQARVSSVFVGAEKIFFEPQEKQVSLVLDENTPFTVLFYGQYIPLHGIEYIIQAAKKLEDMNILWIMIGKGQEREKINKLIGQLELKNIKCVDWVAYADLPKWLSRAHVCLGIFGNTQKANMVIPNKVFQILASGRPLITGDTVAMRELINENSGWGVKLVPAGSPDALADSVEGFFQRRSSFLEWPVNDDVKRKISPEAVGGQMVRILCEISGSIY